MHFNEVPTDLAVKVALWHTSGLVRGNMPYSIAKYKITHLVLKLDKLNWSPWSKCAFNPLIANDEISRRVIKTPRLPTTRYFVAFFMLQNCQRRNISPTLRQNGTWLHRSSKATAHKYLTIHVTHDKLTNTEWWFSMPQSINLYFR